MINEAAPVAKAPKQDQIFLDSFPLGTDGPQILTIVGFNFLKDHEFEDQKTNEIYNSDALEFFLGTRLDGKVHFVKTWPKAYSIGNKSFYHKLYKAALGKEPVAGSSPKELLGGAVMQTIETKEKTSGKGKKYTATAVKGDPSPVHSMLKTTIVPLSDLRPELEKALSPNKEDGVKEDAPF